jgi:putative transposase
VLGDFLADMGVDRTYNRPRVSNDNPFSESEFKTMKYRPNYPGRSPRSRTAAPTWTGTYPGTTAHKHSGIALFSPDEVNDGSWRERWLQRDHPHQAYYAAHPERFRDRPRTVRHRRHQPTQTPKVGRLTPDRLTTPEDNDFGPNGGRTLVEVVAQ